MGTQSIERKPRTVIHTTEIIHLRPRFETPRRRGVSPGCPTAAGGSRRRRVAAGSATPIASF
jgi:hypothetical protein